MLIHLAPIALLIAAACANTEKTIFLGPATINIPSGHPTHVDILTPSNSTIRTHLEAQFPNAELPHGKATWLILDELIEGQRYEVRVCWAATQPTAFRIAVYDVPTVFENLELISDLSEHSWSRQLLEGHRESQRGSTTSPRSSSSGRKASVLLLQILTAADYYTMNKTLMRDVPPVYVDIILDPFIFNVLPRSLLPTVGYIVVVAIASWFISRQISVWIRNVAADTTREKKIQ
ncbi:hypothetical protein F4818DRAFT_33610 [Hypoxylon cercidicola]|nr:hypothetical protein F4818DRAFT_33610 [Hypoxylon cercidicola]